MLTLLLKAPNFLNGRFWQGERVELQECGSPGLLEGWGPARYSADMWSGSNAVGMSLPGCHTIFYRTSSFPAIGDERALAPVIQSSCCFPIESTRILSSSALSNG